MLLYLAESKLRETGRTESEKSRVRQEERRRLESECPHYVAQVERLDDLS